MIASLSLASQFLDGNSLKEWNLGIASYAYVALFDFGASTFILRDISSGEESKVREARSLSKTMIFIGFFVSFLLIFLHFFLDLKSIYPLVIGAMLGRVVINIVGVINVAYGSVTIEKFSKILFAISMLISQYFFLRYDFDKFSLPYSIILSVFLQFIYYFKVNSYLRDLVRTSDFKIKSLWNNKREHVNWIFYTIPALFLFNFQVFAISFWSKAEEVAIYNTIHQLLYAIVAISGVVSYVSGPAISRLNTVCCESRNKLIMHTAKVVSSSVGFGVSIIILGLPWIQNSMFNNVNLSANYALWVCYAAFIIVEVFQMSMVNALIFTGHTDFWKVNLSSAVLNIVLCRLLIPTYGLNGAVLSIIIAQMLTCNYFNIKLAIKKLKLSGFIAFRILTTSLSFFAVNMILNYVYRVFAHTWLLGLGYALILLIFLKYIYGSLTLIIDNYSLVKRNAR